MGITEGQLKKRGKVYHWNHYVNGKQTWKSLKTRNLAEARRIRQALIAKFNENPSRFLAGKRNPTVGEFWDRYSAWLQKHRRPATIDVRTIFWKQLIAFTRAKRLGDITREDIERFKAHRLRLGKAPLSINNAIRDYQAIYNRAVAEGWYTGENPAKGVERFRIPKKQPTFHTEADLGRLIEVAATRGQVVEWAVLLLGWSGLRRNELANLRWENLDFDPEKPVIKIRGSEAFHVKTGEERDIPMNARIKGALLPHRKSEGFVLESNRPSQGKSRYRFDCKRSLVAALEEAGLTTKAPFQMLRRTFGSILVQHGVSIFKVARWMGHSVTVCEKHYAGLLTYDPEIDSF